MNIAKQIAYLLWCGWHDSNCRTPFIWKVLEWFGDERIMLWWSGFAKWERCGVLCWLLGHKPADKAENTYCIRCEMPKLAGGWADNTDICHS